MPTPRRCAYAPCGRSVKPGAKKTTRHCSFECYLLNIKNRPEPRRVHSNDAIVAALEGHETITEAARSLGYNPENLYARAKRSPKVAAALAASRARRRTPVRRCLVCPNRVPRRAARYCSMACYQNHQRQSKTWPDAHRAA